MDGAFRGNGDTGEPPPQALPNFPGTPARVFLLYVQDVVLYLEGKFLGAAVGAAASVGEPLKTAFLVAVEDLVAGLARDAKLPAELGHRLARQPTSHKLQPFIHHRTLLPWHDSLPRKGEKV